MAKMPQGLVGRLQGKNFVKAKPAKKSVDKGALQRRLASAKGPIAPSDNDGDEYPPMR